MRFKTNPLTPAVTQRTLKLGAGVIVASIVLSACNGTGLPGLPQNPDVTPQQTESPGQEDQSTDQQTEAADQEADTSSGEETEASDQEADVVLEQSNFRFSDDEVRVKRGQTITIRLDNTEGLHDFVIDELDVRSERIFGGQSDSITFTIPEDFEQDEVAFFCSVGNHRQLGMEGKLIIE